MWSVLPVGDLDFPLKSGQLAECRDKRYVTRNPDLFTPQLCFSQLSQVFRFVRVRKGPHVLLIPLISSPFETRHLSTCAFPELRPPINEYILYLLGFTQPFINQSFEII